MKICYLEDLKQLQALGWKTEGFVRWQKRWMNRMECFTGDEEAPLVSVEPTDLRWVLEGAWRTAVLTVTDRYILHIVWAMGSATKAAKELGISTQALREVLSSIEKLLYKQRMEEVEHE